MMRIIGILILFLIGWYNCAISGTKCAYNDLRKGASILINDANLGDSVCGNPYSVFYFYGCRGFGYWMVAVDKEDCYTVYYSKSNAPKQSFQYHRVCFRRDDDQMLKLFSLHNKTYGYENRVMDSVYSPIQYYFSIFDKEHNAVFEWDQRTHLADAKKNNPEKVFLPVCIEFLITLEAQLDQLVLAYEGNLQKSAIDQCDDLTYEGAMEFRDGANKSTEYTYDANGNMTRDRNKGIQSISYNMLNQPQTILFNDGHETRYTYAADGRKLRVQYLLNNFAIFDGEEAEESGDGGEEMIPLSMASTNDFVVGDDSN